jgi:hypothetical protein
MSGWRDKAACKREDPAIFEPRRGKGERSGPVEPKGKISLRVMRAIGVCLRDGGCPVRADCKAFRDENELDGVWAGQFYEDNEPTWGARAEAA